MHQGRRRRGLPRAAGHPGFFRQFRSLWRLRSFVRPYSAQMAVMLVCATLGVAASTAIPLVIEAVVNGPIGHHNRGDLLPMFLAALGLGVLEAALIAGRRFVQSVAILQVEKEIRDGFYRHLQRLPVAFHDRWQTGQLLSRATSDLSTIRRFFGFGAIFLLVNALQVLAVMALLLGTYWPLGLLVLVTSLPVIWLGKQFGTGYARVSRRVQDQQGDVATLVEEAASGIRVAKAFGRGPFLARRFVDSAATLRLTSLDSVRLRGRFWALLELVPNVTMALVVLLGAVAVAHHQLSLGGLVAFTTLLVLLQWPIIDLGWILAVAQEAATAADRLYEVFDTASSVTDAPGALAMQRSRGRLAFEGVGFAYPGSRRTVLHDVSFALEPGETLAIVGATGSGKSTLTALPSRLYDVTAGRVTLDGHDVRDVTLASLRRQVATAFEEPALFSMSVRENLVLGRPEATDSEVAEALELAQAGFVYRLPWGLDTRIGEQGLSLSGGQRQRLALARAVLTSPAVLVLDDPLSALDVHTEALVEEALRHVLRDTTALLVVHRPSTVALADRVALLDGGTVVATGTHSQLMDLPGYAAVLSVAAPGWEPAS
jgi:ATP-binding cassette subfamily B protein